MRKIASAALFCLALALSGCGLMMGEMMAVGNGVKKLDVVSGKAGDFRRGAKVAIISPFALSGTGYHIARGDDEAALGVELNRLGVLTPLYTFLPTPGEAQKTGTELLTATPSQAAQRLGLKEEPEYLLTGTVLARETLVAPTKGIIMRAAYRLEFTDLLSHKSLVVEAEVRDFFPDAIPSLAEALNKIIPPEKKPI